MKLKNVLSGEIINTTRCTGKSTALGLRYLSEAISYPGRAIKIIDHADTYVGNICLYNQIQTMVEKLELKGILFDRANLTITFKLYVEEQ